MQFFRTLGVLILLISGNMGIAFASYQDIDHLQETSVSFEFSEDGQDLSYSNLNGPVTLNFSRGLFIDNFSFDLQSSYTSAEVRKYLILSRSIDPSLDIPEIIFPFHFFL